MIWRGGDRSGENFELHEDGQMTARTLNGARHWLRRLVPPRSALPNFLMRLKIEITRRLFGDAGKDRPGDEAAIIQFRLGRVRVVQHDQPDKLRMIGRQITR